MIEEFGLLDIHRPQQDDGQPLSDELSTGCDSAFELVEKITKEKYTGVMAELILR